jgi:hypothetical protein
MPVMAKCKNCGFEFPTKQIMFGSEENLRDNVIGGQIEEICPQCNRQSIYTSNAEFF